MMARAPVASSRFTSRISPPCARAICCASARPDAASLGLGGIERHKQVLGIGDAEAAVFDGNHDALIQRQRQPRDGLAPFAKRGVHRIGEQIDEHLLELIGIGVQRDRRAGIELHAVTLLEQGANASSSGPPERA